MRSLEGGVAAVLLAAACGDGAVPQPPADTCPLVGDAEPVVVDIDSHAELTFALLSDGTAYCWGKDNLGGCGVLSNFDYDWVPSPARVDAADCLLQVSAGSAAVSLGVTAGGDAVSWGREINFYEAGNGPGPGPGIGRGAVLTIPEPVAQVSAGGAVGLAIGQSGSLYHWGSSHTYTIDSPLRYPAPGAVAMAEVGEGVACFLVAGGEVNCFGLDADGQLGVQPGTAADTYAPVRVRLPGAAHKVDVGYARACALLVNGEVWCWGRNSFAFLGTPTEDLPYSADPIRLEVPFKILDVFIDWFGGCFLDLDKRAWCWGVALDDAWPPKPWQPDLQFEKLAVGDKNVCGLTTDRRVFCEGYNPGLGSDPNARAGFVDIAAAIEEAKREECYGLCPAP